MSKHDMTAPGAAGKGLVVRNKYWLAIRDAGKEARVSFTDAIADFNVYEDGEGNASTAPERSFSNFTRSIYAPFGLNRKQVEDKRESRDDLDVIVLDALRLIEGSAASIIHEGMAKGRSRREIKDAVKGYAAQIAATVTVFSKGGYFGEGRAQ
ncbi:hypothetical protein JI664_12635 [Rhodobacter sp. NTK016B]|uniref:hypothetical protein n=1 Tax=Rhodobacter sp. NTK016B TaxID=2759676 RepID=UPI001A906159|nr:hypothetical protein [Rhodobacter sp. NTK016B]MBN8292813.1 hypothetical protein [Rhodobacter sp. NTK016B]